MSDLHLNAPEHLPPVGCPILVLVDEGLVLVERTAFVEQRGLRMAYRVLNPDFSPVQPEIEITGHLAWTYP